MKRVVLLGILLVAAGSADAAMLNKVTKKKGMKAASLVVPAKGQAEGGDVTASADSVSTVAEAADPEGNANADTHPTSAAAAETSGQTTTSVANANAAVAPKKLSASLQSWNEVPVQKANTGEGTTDVTELYFRGAYKITDDLSVGVGQDVIHRMFNSNGSRDQANTFRIYDTFISLSKGKIATLPGGIDFGGSLRAYVPDSQTSIDAKQVVGFRVYGVFSKDFSDRLNVTYIFNPRPNITSQNVYYDTHAQKVQPTYSLLANFLTATFKFSDKLSVYQMVGLEDVFYNAGTWNGTTVHSSDPSEGQNPCYAANETGLEYDVNANLSLTGGITTYGRDVRSQGYALYDDTARYFVTGTVKY